MYKTRPRAGAALSGAAIAVLTLGIASPALAASSGGAVVDRFSNVCVEEGGVTFCSSGRTVTNEVARPNGSGGFVTNGTLRVTGSDGSIFVHRFHEQDVFTSQREREQHRFDVERSSTSNGQTCTITVRFLYAGGHTRIDSFTDTCA